MSDRGEVQALFPSIHIFFSLMLSFPVYVLVALFELGMQVHALRCSYFPVVLCVNLVPRDTSSPRWAAMG